jgi:hypothetical protein
LEEKKKKMKRDEVNATGYHDAEDIQDILFRMQYKYLLHMSHKTWRWSYGLSKISGHNLFHILGIRILTFFISSSSFLSFYFFSVLKIYIIGSHHFL